MYILERIDDSEPGTEQVITGQLGRTDRLRDAIALAIDYDAARVRLEEFNRTVPTFGLDESRTYEFRGTSYRVTAQSGDSS